MRGLVGRKGAAVLFVVMEVVLAIFVIFTLSFIINGYIDNMQYFQSFFAKDNAHIIEALHSVPNGNMYIGYLWSDEKFRVTIAPQTVQVQTDQVEKEGVTSSNTKSKAFGVSTDVPVTPLPQFTPHFYQFVETGGQARSIAIEQQFTAQLSCPSSTAPINGLQVIGSESQFPAGTGKAIAADIDAGLKIAKPDLGDTGVTIYVYIISSPAEQVGVYYKSVDARSARLSCLIAKELSSTQNARSGPAQEAPSEAQAAGDVLVIIQAPDLTKTSEIANKVRAGVVSYWNG